MREDEDVQPAPGASDGVHGGEVGQVEQAHERGAAVGDRVGLCARKLALVVVGQADPRAMPAEGAGDAPAQAAPPPVTSAPLPWSGCGVGLSIFLYPCARPWCENNHSGGTSGGRREQFSSVIGVLQGTFCLI